jgi:hypothetical protein
MISVVSIFGLELRDLMALQICASCATPQAENSFIVCLMYGVRIRMYAGTMACRKQGLWSLSPQVARGVTTPDSDLSPFPGENSRFLIIHLAANFPKGGHARRCRHAFLLT